MNAREKRKYAVKLALMRLEAARQNGDTEVAHSDADDALVELLTNLGLDEVVVAYQLVEKWYA